VTDDSNDADGGSGTDDGHDADDGPDADGSHDDDDSYDAVRAAATDAGTVSVRYDEPVEQAVTVVLDRPDVRNALNDTLRAELAEVLEAADDADAVRVIVLTGAAESGAFCAGSDVNQLRERGLVEQREASERPQIYDVVAGLETPILARLNGHAVGGGCELSMACDVRFAHEDAKFGQPEINLGIIPAGGGTQRLPRLVGPGVAKRLILTGELIDATEAHRIGLVDSVHDDEGLDEEVASVAGAIAEKSPLAAAVAKRAVDASQELGLEQGLEHENQLAVQLFATEDKNEGIDAFLEDREPAFEGR
jgi:enoyl-CoA hydratase